MICTPFTGQKVRGVFLFYSLMATVFRLWYNGLMKEYFDDWTSYDGWIVAHYKEFDVYSLNEIDGKIVAEYCNKDEYEKLFPDGVKK